MKKEIFIPVIRDLSSPRPPTPTNVTKREEFLDVKFDSDQRNKVVTFFQSKYRMKKQKSEFKVKIIAASKAAQLIQKRIRGVLARKRAIQEREKVEKV